MLASIVKSSLLVLLVLAALPAFGAVTPRSEVILPSSDGRHYSEFPAGDAPGGSSPISWSGILGGLTNAGINSQVTGTPFSFNVCPYLEGDENTTASLSVLTVSGDNATTEGWTLSAATCGTGTSNLEHDGSEDGSGVLKLHANGTDTNDDDSADIPWSFVLSDPGDDGYQFPSASSGPSSFSLDAVATFHNISLYWKEGSTGTAGNNTTNQALCRFREKGTSTWFEAMPLRWDNRTEGTGALQIPYGFKEFRGSILQVEPETTYQIECQTETSTKLASTEITTWDETPPEEASPDLRTGTSNAQLTITSGQGGTANAYQVWRDQDGTWTIDRNNAGDGPGGSKSHCISVDAAYVIIDGVHCTDFQDGGIFLGPNAHDVWIINNEIDDFGIDDPSTVWGCNGSSAILTANDDHPNVVRIVIQNNYIHDPKYDANSWDENADGTGNNSDYRVASTNCFGPGTNHPAGSSASDVHDTGGNWVWRYNTFGNASANFLKMFDDGTSGGQNFSYTGDCPRDCDYYENFFTHIWDDGSQNEGAGMNNREYHNYVQYSRTCHGNAPVAVGPRYVFRNICTKGVFGPNSSNAANTPPGNNGWFWKTATKPDNGGGLDVVTFGQGYVLIANNTVYKTAGQSDGRAQSFQLDDGSARNLYVHCNIFDTSSSMGSTNRGYFATAEADGNANIEDNLWGLNQTKPSADATGTTNVAPTYESTPSGSITSLDFRPASGSAQIDTCDFVFPTLNSTFSGSAPDRGAVERTQTEVVYGTR